MDLIIWRPLFMVSALHAIILLLAGFWLWRFPPTNINGILGYRTPLSMKNQANWDMAQRFAGKIMMLCGFGQGVIAYLSQFLPHLKLMTDLGLSLFFLLLFSAIPIWQTEKRLKQAG